MMNGPIPYATALDYSEVVCYS